MAERTTVRLPEDLLRRAKRKAAAEGQTLTSLIEHGLRLALDDGKKVLRRRTLPRVSKATGGPIPGVDLSDLGKLQEIEDIEYIERMSRLK